METVVGRYAEERLESSDERKRVVRAMKRDLAKRSVWVVDDRPVTPLDAAAMILEKIKRDSEEGHFHAPVTRAVIACPAVFDEEEKDKIREAAALAGFREVALLEEPVAAAVAYAEAGVDVGRHVLVYDLGGGTFDLALLAREEGDDTFRLALQPRGERIGGEDFDRAIYDSFDAALRKKTEQSICPDGVDLLLLRQCRRFKESLTWSERPDPLSWHWGQTQVRLKLNRAQFEGLIDQLVERTVRLTRSILEDATAAGCQPDSVILIGGSSRTPCILRRLQETLQVEPRKWQKQDVAVALGAAYHAQRLWGERPNTPPREPTQPHVTSCEPSAEAQGLVVRARAGLDQAAKSAAKARRQLLDSAVQYAQAACDLDPQWPEPFHLKGRILQEKGEWPLAVAAHTAGLRLDPGAARARESRGFCKFMAGDHGDARKDLDESLRLNPTEFAYRYRAAAHLRLDNVAAAVIDIQNALILADEETPRAGLHAVSGLLLRDQLQMTRESIGCFSQALHLMPSEEGSLERRQFLVVGILFEFPELTKFQLAENQSNAGRFSLIAWFRQEIGQVYQAWQRVGARTAAVEFLDRLISELRKLRPSADRSDAGRLNLVAWVQQQLWRACKSVHGGCTREAVVEFFDRNPHEPADRLWEEDPEFALHQAAIWATKPDSERAIAWLKNLLVGQPLFDIQRARRDPWIGSMPDLDLVAFLTPKWSFQERHGRFHNRLKITNLSPFRLSELVVRVRVTRRNGEQDEPMLLSLESLEAGASQTWPSVFATGGGFGGKISGVRVTLRCAEGKAKLVETPSVREASNER